MFCKNCGKKSYENQRFCTSCGTQFSSWDNAEKETSEVRSFRSVLKSKSSWGAGVISRIIVVLFIVGLGIYNSLDKDSITKNNDGLSSFDSGDSQTAISKLQQAKQDVVSDENKINILKNLAYVYLSEDQDELAKSTFKEAYNLTKTNSFDNYLISGEIDLLDNKPNSAILSFKKAYELNPDDFQINNTLALFYVGLEGGSTQYIDYPKALVYAKKAYEYDTKKSEIIKQNLALAYYFNENFDQTISLLSTSDLVQHPYAAYWLGLAYLSKEDHLNAQKYLQKAVNSGVEVPQEITDYLNSK